MPYDEKPEYAQVLQRPIIVLGSARSGTTFLQACLSSSPEVATLIEPRLVWKFGNDHLSDLLEPHHARSDVIAHIRSNFAKEILAQNRQRLLEKSPSNALRPGFVHRVFPDALFIHIIRDPRHSVLSIRSFWEKSAQGMQRIAPGRLRQRLREINWRRLPHYSREIVRRLAPSWARPMVGQNMWGPRLPGMEQMTRQMDLLDICCLQWRTCVERSVQYGKSLPADQYLQVHIEDLDVDLARRIADFCQLSDTGAPMKLFESQYDPARGQKHKAAADAQTLERIRQWCEPTTRWLGRYEDW